MTALREAAAGADRVRRIVRDLTTLFGWKAAEATAAVEALAQSGVLRLGLTLDGEAGEWFALAGL